MVVVGVVKVTGRQSGVIVASTVHGRILQRCRTDKCSQADDQVASSFSSPCERLRFANQLRAYCHLVYWAWNKITSAKADQRRTHKHKPMITESKSTE